jgi:hypothetical protein
MRRPLLVLAMLVSLWPLAVVVVGVAGSSNSTKERREGGESPTAVARLNVLAQRQKSLQQQLDKSPALHGTADPDLASAAEELATDFAAWSAANESQESDARLAGLAAEVDNNVAAFGKGPSEAKLNALNAAVDAYNEALERTRGK